MLEDDEPEPPFHEPLTEAVEQMFEQGVASKTLPIAGLSVDFIEALGSDRFDAAAAGDKLKAEAARSILVAAAVAAHGRDFASASNLLRLMLSFSPLSPQLAEGVRLAFDQHAEAIDSRKHDIVLERLRIAQVLLARRSCWCSCSC